MLGTPALASSRTALQPHPPTWLLLFVAVSPICWLGLILFSWQGLYTAWSCRVLQDLSTFRVPAQESPHFPLDVLSTQVADRPPSTFNGWGTANEAWSDSYNPERKEERKGKGIICVTDTLHQKLEDSDSVPATEENNRTDFPWPLPVWTCLQSHIFAKPRFREMLAL